MNERVSDKTNLQNPWQSKANCKSDGMNEEIERISSTTFPMTQGMWHGRVRGVTIGMSLSKVLGLKTIPFNWLDQRCEAQNT